MLLMSSRLLFTSDVPLLAKDVKAVANRLVLAGVKGYDVPDANFDVCFSI